MQTLALDRDFQPVARLHWQRAVTLVFTNKAEVLEYYEDTTIRSPSFSMPVPAVIRFLKAKRQRKQVVKFSRINIFIRDNHTCQYCGKVFPPNQLTYDHVLPRSQGGKTCWENIVSACSGAKGCNSRKGGRTPEQAGMRLLSKPKKPAYLPTVQMKLTGDSVPEVWRSYIYWTTEIDE